MDEQSNQVVIYFCNGRMARIPKDRLKFVHLGQRIDEEYTPDIEGGVAMVNWDNVCFIREWQPTQEDDFNDTV